MTIQIPIPFVGWFTIDEEETEQMLREQIHSQQMEIHRLNKKIIELQLLADKQKRKVKDGTTNVK
jgi:hemolysin-activating ACP:hemolysin acyltransferase